jgi:tetratricopeptide (TPR) repeat protein
MASTLQNLGQLELSQGNYERASQFLQETLKVLGDVGGNDQTAVVLYRLGVVARCREDYTGALSFEQRCLTLTHELGDKHVKGYALCELGIIAQRLGQSDRATAVLKESVGMLSGVGDRWGLTRGLEALAAVALEQQQLARAARLFGAAEAWREAMGAPIEPFERLAQQSQVDEVRAGLGTAASEKLWNEGRAMTSQETVAFGLEETSPVLIGEGR